MLKKVFENVRIFILNILGVAGVCNALIDEVTDLQKRLSDLETKVSNFESVYAPKKLIDDINKRIEDDNIGIRANFYLDKDSINEINGKIYEINNQLSALTEQVKNPLGAGRRERGTADEIEKIIDYRMSGKSLGEIAKIMTNDTGKR